jgi:hypothetical protein
VPLLDCLREVTALFPAPGNTIWATAFALDDNHVNWEIIGECTAENYAKELCAAMENAPNFQKPKLTVEPSRKKEGESSYRLTFEFRPAAK